jgi:hypothetical protein
MPMRPISLAVLLAAGVALSAAPADAAKRKRAVPESVLMPSRSEARVVVRRPRTRITVTRRSYLDAGTEVYPGSQAYRDYVFSPNYFRPTDVAIPWQIQDSSLPPPFWIPSYHTPSWGN